MDDGMESPEAGASGIDEAVAADDDIVHRITTDCGVLVFRCDRDGRIMYLNQAADAILGVPRQNLLGKRIPEVIPSHSSHASGSAEALDDVFVGMSLAEYRFSITSEGSQRDYLVILAPAAHVNGEVTHAHGVAVDISCQRQKVREAREADHRKERFLAFVAHEMRNPLSSISSGVRMLRRDPPAEQPTKVLQMMDLQVEYLSRLVGDLLDVSRSNHGKMLILRKPLNIRDAVTLALEGSRCAVERNGHCLHVSVPREEIVLSGDLQRLAQVISNLIDNAAKYTPTGGEINLSVIEEEDEVVLTVRDNGMGISEEQLPYVFEMFRQLHGEDGHRDGGLGIGLFLVKMIVEAHQGTIHVHSDGKGKGSSFVVRLPNADCGEVQKT